MKITVRCPCCGEQIYIDIDLSPKYEELSEDEQKKILDKMGIEFG